VFKISQIFMFCLVAFVVQVQVQAQSSDPTKPLNFVATAGGVAGSAQETIKLTSILMSSERKIAIINGQVLQEGQTLKGVGAQVKKIDADAVTLQQNGKVWRVPLNSTVIRK
jgi:MSHA biogenesis protein MshK